MPHHHHAIGIREGRLCQFRRDRPDPIGDQAPGYLMVPRVAAALTLVAPTALHRLRGGVGELQAAPDSIQPVALERSRSSRPDPIRAVGECHAPWTWTPGQPSCIRRALRTREEERVDGSPDCENERSGHVRRHAATPDTIPYIAMETDDAPQTQEAPDQEPLPATVPGWNPPRRVARPLEHPFPQPPTAATRQGKLPQGHAWRGRKDRLGPRQP